MDIKQELAKAIHGDNFDVTEDGVYFPRQGIMAQGMYRERVNGGEWQYSKNLVVDQGLAHILNVAMGVTPKPTGYYLALFSGATAPAPNWTAANFASVASEIVSTTEGHSGATRPVWTPSPAVTNTIDNFGAAASVTIATTGTLNVTGTALLTNSTRGGTAGALISATKYPAARTFQNGDVFEIGYRFALTV